MPNILVIDDELSIRESFSLILEGKYQVLLAASGEAALKIAADQKIDLAYLDIRMPGLNGLETLARLKEIDPELEVIMVTAVNDVQNASEAIKQGARDYVVKPFDVNQITRLTEQTLRKKALLEESALVQKNVGRSRPELLGQHEQITNISKIISQLKEDQRVLILGEPGTEKETIARLIHEKSSRRSYAFRTACLFPAMSSGQMRTLFFGRGKGSSTVDLSAKNGLFEQVKAGTLFIDSIQLLVSDIFKMIAAASFQRQGSAARIKIEARLIAGGRPALADKNDQLFEYFSEVCIRVPPLRERSSDIPVLAGHFLEKFNQRYNRNIKLAPEALEAMTNYSWPGNTAQLESLIERLILTADSNQVSPEDLPLDITLQSSRSAGRDLINGFERQYIKSVYERSGRDQKKAAALLGLTPLLLETKI